MLESETKQSAMGMVGRLNPRTMVETRGKRTATREKRRCREGGCRSDIRATYIKINGRSRLRYSLLQQPALPGVSSSDSKLEGLRLVGGGKFLVFRRIGVE